MVVTEKLIERAVSGLLVGWLAKRVDVDVEATLLRDLGEDAHGLVLTVGDQEFRVLVERA